MRILAFTLGVLLLLMYILVGDASGDIYTWVDRDGQVHFTDDHSAVPPEYRARAQSRPSSPPSEPLPPPEPPKTSKKGKPSKGKLSKSPPPRLPSTRGPLKVVAVVDGDTIIITGGDKVRYAGLNTPESRHPDKLPEYCGQEAFEANRRLVSGKTVRLEFDDRQRDRYGRLLAYVYVDGLFVNAELIRQGYAQVSTYKDNQRHHKEFTRLQQIAIAARSGLWGGCVDIRVPQAQSKPHVKPRGR